jgi:hypothetical protein
MDEEYDSALVGLRWRKRTNFGHQSGSPEFSFFPLPTAVLIFQPPLDPP